MRTVCWQMHRPSLNDVPSIMHLSCSKAERRCISSEANDRILIWYQLLSDYFYWNTLGSYESVKRKNVFHWSNDDVLFFRCSPVWLPRKREGQKRKQRRLYGSKQRLLWPLYLWRVRPVLERCMTRELEHVPLLTYFQVGYGSERRANRLF